MMGMPVESIGELAEESEAITPHTPSNYIKQMKHKFDQKSDHESKSKKSFSRHSVRSKTFSVIDGFKNSKTQMSFDFDNSVYMSNFRDMK